MDKYQELEEIEVYQLAVALADRIWEIVSSWSHFARDTVGKQMVRAADSIAANVAESYGRYHYGDKLNFLYYSRGSLYETKLAPKLNAYIASKRQQRTQAAK